MARRRSTPLQETRRGRLLRLHACTRHHQLADRQTSDEPCRHQLVGCRSCRSEGAERRGEGTKNPAAFVCRAGPGRTMTPCAPASESLFPRTGAGRRGDVSMVADERLRPTRATDDDFRGGGQQEVSRRPSASRHARLTGRTKASDEVPGLRGKASSAAGRDKGEPERTSCVVGGRRTRPRRGEDEGWLRYHRSLLPSRHLPPPSSLLLLRRRKAVGPKSDRRIREGMLETPFRSLGRLGRSRHPSARREEESGNRSRGEKEGCESWPVCLLSLLSSGLFRGVGRARKVSCGGG